MKRVTIALFTILITIGASAQINISKYGAIDGINETGQTRVIVGEDYYFTSELNEDGEVYRLEGVPAEGDHIRSITEDEFQKVKTAFEEKFDMELRHQSNSGQSINEGTWSSTRDNIEFEIVVDEYDSADYHPYEIKMSITHTD
ncbi:hypothetical protein [Carboxylicivirga marina]|uniref:Secreted protein n=1 Tax=Carboxylicivirga marina TaxID=2800988 RepID=A0ABS1HIA3_9BACT|nr:hypothetical protein [Carboxylicivirga marina]MBK3517361.1 hypothetical protein [Carboxylicivirga marina]